MPSLAPKTPARSQLSRFARPPECGSSAWVTSSPVTSPSQARHLAICQLGLSLGFDCSARQAGLLRKLAQRWGAIWAAF